MCRHFYRFCYKRLYLKDSCVYLHLSKLYPLNGRVCGVRTQPKAKNVDNAAFLAFYLLSISKKLSVCQKAEIDINDILGAFKKQCSGYVTLVSLLGDKALKKWILTTIVSFFSKIVIFKVKCREKTNQTRWIGELNDRENVWGNF